MSDLTNLDHSHHFFRHIKKSWIDDGLVDPAAFRLRRNQEGQFEKGLSINWVEYFGTLTPQDAIAPLRHILTGKNRKVGGESKFALLNVGEAKDAAAQYTTIDIVLNKEKNDPSHSLVKGYEAYNDQVAEELAKVIIDTYPPI